MTLKLTYAGFNYVADIDGSYANANSLSSMISSTDANSVELTEDYGIDAATSSIYADYSTATTTGNTDTLADLTTTIEDAENDGLSVMVRPLVDFTVDATKAMLKSSDGTQYADGDWRAYYKPTDVATFFNSYDTMIVAQAKAAQAGGAQLFDIGTELDQLTGPAYLADWTKIITDVRAVFSGKLTYSAISDDDLSPWQYGGGQPAAGTGNLATQVSFWSQLDYVGIDEYAAISDADNGGANPDPTLAQLVAGWEDTPTDPTTKQMTGGLSLIKYYENVAATIGKPLLFTELGYNSAPDAASQPFFTSSSVYDPTLQANLYKAFFTAWQAEGNTSLQGVYIWDWEPDPATVGAGSSPTWTPQGDTGSLQAVDAGFTAATACFASGTRIATADGECAVERLAPGMPVRILGAEAFARVVWLGHRRVDCRHHPRPHDVWPVRVRPGAFRAGVPRRDLLLSPDHAVFIDGVLIPIRYLVNGATIAQQVVDSVSYWHVELPRHAVLFAEGLATESYLDTGNRGAFANGGAAVRMHADFAPADFALRVWESDACAKLVRGGAELVAARSHLLERAKMLGHAVTRKPALRVVADGREVPAAVNATHRFVLPRCPRGVRLVSRSAVPAQVQDDSDDHRRLGVAVSRILLDGAPIPLTDARLGAGWHALECGAGGAQWRWTDGDAALALSPGGVLEIAVSMTGRYWLESAGAFASRIHPQMTQIGADEKAMPAARQKRWSSLR
jgi:hypothetical protein